MLGQLPLERITPGLIFKKVGVDYAGPLYVKVVWCVEQPQSKPTSVFLCLSQ